ncbi:DcrB-related protein [Pseudomonas sp. NBRC 111144]|uniref:DcrB-related protein n=1 Tax=Pseudomonas sp. NBRC 111144 TaxID=1661059 RepID=UPI0006D4602C|nr:DcrB-related protein [Pseudomonas sp. NBRC 111144]
MRRNIYDRLSERREREEPLERERLEEEVRNAEPPQPERFLTNELSFIRPENLKDKTFHVFTLTDIGPSPFSFVVGRSSVEPDADLETLAQQLLGELKKTLSHVQWIEPVAPVEVAGLEARRVEFRWRQQGQPVHQVQLIFLHQDEYMRPLLMQITGTSNSPKGMTAEERSAFDSLVESLQLRYLSANEGDAEQAESA